MKTFFCAFVKANGNSRINRVRRRGEPEDDSTAGKRVETITGEQLEEMEERGGTVVIGGEG